VDAGVIDALAAAPSYQVHEAGANAATRAVNNYRALNSRSNEQAVIDEIAEAEVVTTAVGANILRFGAPGIATGIDTRPAGMPPLTVMACENALNATDQLECEVSQVLSDRPNGWLAARRSSPTPPSTASCRR